MTDIESKISALEQRAKEYIKVDYVDNQRFEKLKKQIFKYKVELFIYLSTISLLLYFKPAVISKTEIIAIKLKQPETDSNGVLHSVKKMEVKKIDYSKLIGCWLIIATLIVVLINYYKK